MAIEAKKINFHKVIMTIFIMVAFCTPSNCWSGEFPNKYTKLRAVCASPGASVHMVQVAIGKAIEKYTPVRKWMVQPLGGPDVWLPMMRQGQCDFANNNAADTLDAFFGRGPYKDMGFQPIRLNAAGHEYFFAFWSIAKSNITRVEDLKGKVAYIKFKGDPMFIQMAKLQLASAGMSFEDLKAAMSFSSVKDAIRQLIEGKIDAIFFPAVPGPIMQINQAAKECKFVKLTKDQANYVMENSEGYYVQDIPANDPRFRNKSAVENAICYQNVMITPEDEPEEVVYEVTKALYDHNDEYCDSHPACKYWNINHKPISYTVPYHEGAIRYFKEKGLWSAKNEAYQKKILEKQKKALTQKQ